MRTVIETPAFLEAAENAGVEGDVLDQVVDLIAFGTTLGEPALDIDGLCSHGLRRAETGADEDLEILTYSAGDDIPLFLLDICFAGDPLQLARRDHIELAAALSEIGMEYRTGARAKVVELRKACDGENE
jgi:hypothetical protein